MKKREDGYYWVRMNPAFHGQWVIAQYRSCAYPQAYRELIMEKNPERSECHEWFIRDWQYPDSEIIEVDENRIVRND